MFVAVSVIKPQVSRDIFPPNRIEEIAENIVSCGGLLRPLLVQAGEFDRENFVQRFDLVSGDLYYWASVRAKEIDPIAFEEVNAFVLGKGQDPKPYLSQLK
jgi:hypothetical protein